MVVPLSTIQRNQALANQMLGQALTVQPIMHPLQGLAQLAQAFSGNILANRAERQQEERDAAAQEALTMLMGSPSLGAPAAPGDLLAGSIASAAPAAGTPGLSSPGLPEIMQFRQEFPEMAGLADPLVEAALNPASAPETYTMVEDPTQFGFAPGTVVQRGSRGGLDVLQKPQAAAASPKFQTDLGKMLADQALAEETFGTDSPQAMAFAEALRSEQAGEPPDLSDEAGQRKEFTALSKNFVTMRNAYEKIQSARDTAAGDVSLIFSYMRLLDPQSTVREGEFATAEQTAGVPARVRNLYNRVITGERLAPKQRQEFKGQAGDLYATSAAQQDQLENQFRGLAERSGLRPDNVVLDYQGDLRDFSAKPPKGKKKPALQPSVSAPGPLLGGLSFEGMTPEELADVDLNSLNKAQLDAYEAALDAAR